MFDWQIIAVAGVLVLASIYVGWRGWRRLTSFKPKKKLRASSCSGGCGCTSKPEVARASRP